VCYIDSPFSRKKLWTVEKVDGIKNISLTCVLHRFGLFQGKTVDGIKNISLTCVLHRFGLFQEETVHGGESGWYKKISLSLVLYCVLH